MKIVEGIKPAAAAGGKLEGEKRDDLFLSLISGKDATEAVETSRGVFTVKYPKPKDIVAIGRLMAARRGGLPPESLGAEAEMLNAVASTLDALVVSGPDWFEKARKGGEFTFLDAPSPTFLTELYGKAHSFRGEVESVLEQGEKPAAVGVPASEGADEAVDGGAFGDISGES